MGLRKVTPSSGSYGRDMFFSSIARKGTKTRVTGTSRPDAGWVSAGGICEVKSFS